MVQRVVAVQTVGITSSQTEDITAVRLPVVSGKEAVT